VAGFTGSLGAGKVMRVHSGSGPASALAAADLLGADVHVFRSAEGSFVTVRLDVGMRARGNAEQIRRFPNLRKRGSTSARRCTGSYA
jgi:hypothetical protein